MRQFSAAVSLIRPAQIRALKKQYILKQKVEENPCAYKIHSGRANENEKIETSVYDRVVEQRRAELAVSIQASMTKLIFLDSSFKNSDPENLFPGYTFYLKMKIVV